MDQIEAHAPACKRMKEDKATEDSTFGNTDDVRTVNKSVVSSVDVDLTDDAWLLVFSYLDTADKIHGRVARVCRRWRKLNDISWKSVTSLSLTVQQVFENLLWIPSDQDTLKVMRHALQVCLQRCGTSLKRLDLYPFSPNLFNSHVLDLMIRHSASLLELNLSRSNINNSQLKTIAQRIPRLRSIDLSGCDEISEDGLRDAFTVGLQSLKSLYVAHTMITGEFFSLAPPSLTEVIVNYCSKITDRGVRLLADNCPNLEITDICNEYSSLSAQSIAYVYKNCPKLKRLENALFLSKGWDLPTLQILYSLPLLEDLHVFDDNQHLLTDQFVGGLSRHCPRISTIAFYYCAKLTDNALNHISTWVHLKSIFIIHSNQITDEGFIHFRSACPKLKEVRLNHCEQITHVGVGHLVSAHPSLLELEIVSCHSVTEQVFPVLESSLQHRQETHPLNMRIHSSRRLPSLEAARLRKNPKIHLSIRYIINQ